MMEYVLIIIVTILILWGLYTEVEKIYNKKHNKPISTTKKTKPTGQKEVNKRPNRGN